MCRARRKRLRAERKHAEERALWEQQRAAMVARVDEQFSVRVHLNPQQQWRKGEGAGGAGGGPWAPSVGSAEGGGHVHDEEVAAFILTARGGSKGKGGGRQQFGSSDGLAGDIGITGAGARGSVLKDRARRGPGQGQGQGGLQHSASSGVLPLSLAPGSAGGAQGQRWTVAAELHDRKLYSAHPAPGLSLDLPRESKSAGT